MYPTINRIKTGQGLKQLIKQRGYTVKDIQEYLSLACIQTVYRWLDGSNIPSVDNLYALSVFLRVPMDDLIVGNRAEIVWEEHVRWLWKRCLIYEQELKRRQLV